MLALCEGAEVAVGQHQAPVHMAHDSDSNCRVLHDAVRGCSSVPTQVLSPATHPPACRLTPHPPACRQANQRAACCLPISGGQLKIDSALWALLSLLVRVSAVLPVQSFADKLLVQELHPSKSPCVLYSCCLSSQHSPAAPLLGRSLEYG